MLQNPVSVALLLLTGYFFFVVATHRRRSLNTKHALLGAGLLATLTTAAALMATNPV